MSHKQDFLDDLSLEIQKNPIIKKDSTKKYIQNRPIPRPFRYDFVDLIIEIREYCDENCIDLFSDCVEKDFLIFVKRLEKFHC